MLWSGPIVVWSSPIASISAIRAFAWASARDSPAPLVRSETAESVSSPTESTVSSTISVSEITKAKPPRSLGRRENLGLSFITKVYCIYFENTSNAFCVSSSLSLVGFG